MTASIRVSMILGTLVDNLTQRYSGVTRRVKTNGVNSQSLELQMRAFLLIDLELIVF